MRGLPSIRAVIERPGGPVRDAVVPPRAARFIDDAAIVATFGENETQFTIGEQLGFVDGLPRRDMVSFGGDHKHRRCDVLQRDHPALNSESVSRQPVFQKHSAQILRMHQGRHPSGVGKPYADVGGHILSAQKIALRSAGPDQIFGLYGSGSPDGPSAGGGDSPGPTSNPPERRSGFRRETARVPLLRRNPLAPP